MLFCHQKYRRARGPWTATLALIEVNEIAQNQKTFLPAKNIQNLCNFLGIGTLCLHRCPKWIQKWPFSLATPQLVEAMDQSETKL